MSEFDGDWVKPRLDGWESGNSPPESPETQPKTSAMNRLLTRPEFAAGAALVISVGAVASGAILKGDKLANSLKPKPAAALSGTCPQPSQKTVEHVNQLFTEPVAKARAEYRKRTLDGYARQGDEMLPNLFGSTGPNMLGNTQWYFKKFKVDLELASAAEKLPAGFRAPTEKDIESDAFGFNVLGLAAGLSEVPAHYTLMSGLRKIRLVSGSKDAEFAYEEPGTLDWNIRTRMPNLDYMPFEVGTALGYFTEDKMCVGNSGSDSAFVKSSQGPFESPLAPVGTDGSVTPLWDYWDGHAKAANVNVLDGRAVSSTTTDKAEILALISEPAVVASAMSPDHPILRSKVIEVLAELYQRQPVVVRRLAVEAARYPMFVRPTPAGSRHDRVIQQPKF